MKIIKRVSAFAVTLALSLSLVTIPVHADVSYDYDSSLTSYLVDIAKLPVDAAREFNNLLFGGNLFGPKTPLNVECTAGELNEGIKYFNDHHCDLFRSFLSQGLVKPIFTEQPYAIMKYDAAKDCYHPYDSQANAWITDRHGNYPWTSKANGDAWLGVQCSSAESETIPAPSSGRSQWLDSQSVDWSKAVIVTEQSLSDSVTSFNALGDTCSLSRTTIGSAATPVKYIYKTGGSYGKVFCNYRGWPYIAYVDKDTTVTNQTFNYDSGNTYEGDVVYDQGTIDKSTLVNQAPITWDESQNFYQTINNENGVFTFVDADGEVHQQYIDSLTYNTDSRSYTVNTYDTTYNITNNYYEFNYYTYNIQYTYNNTYVTYIGSTAEFVPAIYEYYYQLPDGRSSADLTDEDIAGLSFQFHDILNYKKSATDTSLRALYHFDGNTNDSSFWSGQGAFTWNTGASITYMESNAFNGCLYLDEKAHQFTITLPSSIGSGDFTLQWRYYQNSATTSNNIDNYVSVGGSTLMKWSEQYLYDGGGNQIAGLSVGTWQELALVRHSGTLYLYHNGVRLTSSANSSPYTGTIVFSLGGSSKAYAMFDELRVLNFAVVEGGSPYTPTAVPFDTNAILVLPDGATPVAEEHWEWDTTIEPVRAFDFTYYDPSVFYALPDRKDSNGWSQYYDSVAGRIQNMTTFVRCPTSLPYSVSDGFISFAPSAYPVAWCDDNYVSAGMSQTKLASFTRVKYSNYLFLPLGFSSGVISISLVLSDGSVLSGSGEFSSLNLTLRSPADDSVYITFKRVALQRYDCVKRDSSSTSYGYWRDYSGYDYVLGMVGNIPDLVYMDVVRGDTPNTGHKRVSAVYSSDEIQPNTAAIQSDIPVNGYTVGGVRPTFPQRGDVWFPVEGNRISGVYIYNGQAWEETNARWWTGKRWIPIYAFDIVTLADLWDVVSGESGEPVTPAITSDYGFWNWWKTQWLDFRQWLSSLFSSGSITINPGGSSGSSGSGTGFFQKIKDALADGISKLIEGLFDVITETIKAIISTVTDLLSSLFSFVTDTVLGGIKNFFSFFTDGSLFEFFQPETVQNEDGSETTTVSLPEGITSVFALFSGIFLALPAEIRWLLIFGVGALALISVLKFVYS